MPASIEKLQRDLKDPRFTVVAVNIKDTKEEVGPWIQSRASLRSFSSTRARW
jgi:hypothetical protein